MSLTNEHQLILILEFSISKTRIILKSDQKNMSLTNEHQLTNFHYTSISPRWTTPIWATCSWNTLSGTHLVSESVIMKFVLICSIDTWKIWTLSLTTRNFKSICYDFDKLLLFLEYNFAALLSQLILNDLSIPSTICNLVIKFHNHIA